MDADFVSMPADPRDNVTGDRGPVYNPMLISTRPTV
jgi:hypothetical protein